MRKSIMAVALIVVLAPAVASAQTKSGKSGVYEQLNLFGEAFERIRHDAVEPVGDTKLIETAIAGMLAGLGPHSVYLNETEYKALQSQASDESAQTGLVVTHDNGQVKVVAPRDGSPAAATAASKLPPGSLRRSRMKPTSLLPACCWRSLTASVSLPGVASSKPARRI